MNMRYKGKYQLSQIAADKFSQKLLRDDEDVSLAKTFHFGADRDRYPDAGFLTEFLPQLDIGQL